MNFYNSHNSYKGKIIKCDMPISHLKISQSKEFCSYAEINIFC